MFFSITLCQNLNIWISDLCLIWWWGVTYMIYAYLPVLWPMDWSNVQSTKQFNWTRWHEYWAILHISYHNHAMSPFSYTSLYMYLKASNNYVDERFFSFSYNFLCLWTLFLFINFVNYNKRRVFVWQSITRNAGSVMGVFECKNVCTF